MMLTRAHLPRRTFLRGLGTAIALPMLDINTVSGDLDLADVRSERVHIRSVSGNLTYDGPLAKAGRYDLNSHSGDIRLLVPAGVGFELEANTFSGSLRSDLPLTLRGATRPETERDDDDTPRGRRNSQSLRGTFRVAKITSFNDGDAMRPPSAAEENLS